MKPVGKPDAGNPHVRFDERGRETECCHMAQATAPVLDSTERYPISVKIINADALRLCTSQRKSYLSCTVNADTTADFQIEISGKVALATNDFLF
jgi:hypothetical protein